MAPADSISSASTKVSAPSAGRDYPRLVGDVGGTNARFGLIAAPDAPIEHIAALRCADYAGPAEAIRAYLQEHRLPAPRHAAIGIANPVTGDSIKMTNHSWSFSIETERQSLGLSTLLFVNDFTALALSLPYLSATDLRQIGGGAAQSNAAIAVIGPGTGLGVSGLIPTESGYVPLQGEGGHVTVSAQTDDEHQVVALLAQQYGHVSAERLVSGPGIQAIYQSLARLRGRQVEELSPPQISKLAIESGDVLAKEALHMFCAFLGTTAGNLALTLGSLGGVFIGGGVVPKLGEFFSASCFRERFEAKGRFKPYLQKIPSFVITAPYPALTGAAAALEQSLR